MGNSNIDQDGQERCEQRSKCVVHTTVLVDFDDLVNNPSHQIHPGKGGGKGKTGNNSVERLTFEFTGDEDSSFLSRHFLYIKLRFYSGRKSSSNKIFLYFFVFFKYPFIILGFSSLLELYPDDSDSVSVSLSSSDISPSEDISSDNLKYPELDDQPSGPELFIIIYSIF